jgi:hypothetical protein
MDQSPPSLSKFYMCTQAEMVIGLGSKSIKVTKNCWDNNTQVGIDCDNRCKEHMEKCSEFNQLSCIQEATNKIYQAWCKFGIIIEDDLSSYAKWEDCKHCTDHQKGRFSLDDFKGYNNEAQACRNEWRLFKKRSNSLQEDKFSPKKSQSCKNSCQVFWEMEMKRLSISLLQIALQ